MSAIDYRTNYEQYWARPDRWDSHSFTDPSGLADQILATCGGGSLVDVGCGMGLLVRTLLARGVDARGLDVAPRCVAAGNTGSPGRFVEGSVLDLPFADGALDTLVSTDVMEHLAEADVARAIAELARVARRYVFVRLSTVPDRDGTWHLTVRPRAWWEERFFRAGLRRHPLTQKILPFASLEDEGPQITIVFEKIPEGAARRYPLESLTPARDLHMDMLRESGRRSDAHIARYTLACEFIRSGDTVLDAASGLGYGAAILSANSRAVRVIGVDAEESAVVYAKANFGAEGAPVEFRTGDAADLSFLADRSIDLIVSFETLEHVPDPRRLLAEFQRVLTPGGRLIVSVPNDWTDETGRDPNPHHLHVYTWETLAGQITDRFLIERVYAQTAGGGMKFSDRPRCLDEIEFDADPAGDHALRSKAEAEWYLAVAMKSPLSAGKEGYRETAYPDHADLPGYHITAFARDYDNPWLVRSLVSIGMRCTNPELLSSLARGALAQARAGSPDQGAALCVLGYQLLERDDRAGSPDLLARIEEYQARADGSPQAMRWCVSTLYVAARLLQATGQRAQAREMFLRCARSDCTRFSPLLASKTIDAYFRAGVLSALDGDTGAARDCWVAGLNEARRVLSGDWTNVWGTPERPVTFGLPEVAVLTDLASRCSFALDSLGVWDQRPGVAWNAAARQTFADGREWLASVTRANGWLRSQLDATAQTNERLVGDMGRLTAWIRNRDEGIEWLKVQGRSLETGLADHQKTIASLKEHVETLEKTKSWLLDQAKAWQTTAEARERVNVELKDWNQQLQAGRDYLSAQARAWENATKERDAGLAELKDWCAKLSEANRWLEGQVAAWRTAVEERDRRLAELTSELREARSKRSGSEAGAPRR